MGGKDKEIYQKIEEIKHDKQVLWIIRKDCIISNNDFAIYKESTKRLIKQRRPGWDVIIKWAIKSELIAQE